MKQELEWTGERLTTAVFNENTIEHLHRYALAAEWASGKVVLDIACGEGYGANLLAQTARQVTGVDIDKRTIQFASGKYKKSNLSFLEGSVTAIPMETGSVDLVTSFETIEHLVEHDAMLGEIKRVLKPDGICLISTPDKVVKAVLSEHENRYHLRELTMQEFKELINRYFRHAVFLNQKTNMASFISLCEPEPITLRAYEGDFEKTLISDTMLEPQYNIGVASDSPIPLPSASYYIHRNLLSELYNQKQEVYRSVTYRIGNMIVSPFRFLIRPFRKK